MSQESPRDSEAQTVASEIDMGWSTDPGEGGTMVCECNCESCSGPQMSTGLCTWCNKTVCLAYCYRLDKQACHVCFDAVEMLDSQDAAEADRQWVPVPVSQSDEEEEELQIRS